MARGDKEYRKGTIQRVYKTDSNGDPISHLERDQDGNFWHVRADAEPKLLRNDEVDSIAAEESTRAEGGGGGGGGGGNG